jgi:uncharacterized protein (TIGR04255 family)
MKFEKPPLIELVAEFRWYGTDPNGQNVIDPNAIAVSGSELELFYDTFRQIVAERGFNTSERLIPNGFPHPMQQPVIRYRNSDAAKANAVLQIGVGLMSVHALPPYENWEAFRPVIETALSSLIETRRRVVDNRLKELPRPLPLTEDKEFVAISLRYIDSFGPEMSRGRTIRQFFDEVLGVKVTIPKAISDQVADPASISVSLQMKTTLENGGQLQMGLGPNPNDSQSIVMDTIVLCEERVRWNLEGPMALLERSHDSIRQLFVGMTTPIHDLMQPLDAEARSL